MKNRHKPKSLDGYPLDKPNKNSLWSHCNDLHILDDARHDGLTFKPIGYTPTYLPSPAQELGAHTAPLFAGRVDGWCQWPNMWHGDFAVCRVLSAPLELSGRNLDSKPLTADEVLRWQEYEDQYVCVSMAGRGLGVKRLGVDTRRPGRAKIVLGVDNAPHFQPWFVDTEDLPVVVFAVVELVIPADRGADQIPDQLKAEYERLYRLDGTRKSNPDRNGVERPAKVVQMPGSAVQK